VAGVGAVPCSRQAGGGRAEGELASSHGLQPHHWWLWGPLQVVCKRMTLNPGLLAAGGGCCPSGFVTSFCSQQHPVFC